MVDLSYAILTHNEGTSVEYLLKMLCDHIEQNNMNQEIVILDDESTDDATLQIFETYKQKPFVHVYTQKHSGDFSEQKNCLNSHCTGEWIFNLDADEHVFSQFLDIIPSLISNNPTIEAFWIPRVNTVDGITANHLARWGWSIRKMEDVVAIKQTTDSYKLSDAYALLVSNQLIISESEDGVITYYVPVVCWPDHQMRLYKNDPNIHWINKVHERLVGFNYYTHLPEHINFSIIHPKSIDRQEQQNTLYNTLRRGTNG